MNARLYLRLLRPGIRLSSGCGAAKAGQTNGSQSSAAAGQQVAPGERGGLLVHFWGLRWLGVVRRLG